LSESRNRFEREPETGGTTGRDKPRFEHKDLMSKFRNILQATWFEKTPKESTGFMLERIL
jgi:hypothetical protein